MSNEIQLFGLTERQRVLADIIWGMDRQEDLDSFFASLPKFLRREAEAVQAAIIAAMFDSVEDTDLAKSVLDRISK